MKPSISYVLFLIFTITANSASAADEVMVVVKDSTGKKVLHDVRYHIAPVTKGGSLKLTDTINKKKVCPYVVHDPKDNVGGEFKFSMTFTYKPETYLKTSRVLGIDSGVLNTACEKSTYWTVIDVEGKTPDNLITTGGRFETEETCFQVVEYPKPTSAKVHSYMLQHCPSFCGGRPRPCYNISISSYNGDNRLSTVGGTPFEFVFHKIAK